MKNEARALQMPTVCTFHAPTALGMQGTNAELQSHCLARTIILWTQFSAIPRNDCTLWLTFSLVSSSLSKRESGVARLQCRCS